MIRGRKKEMIVTPDGLKVFPEDVESVLKQIAGVRDSAVIGKDRVHAVLVLEPGANPDEIVRQANQQSGAAPEDSRGFRLDRRRIAAHGHHSQAAARRDRRAHR